MFDWIGDLEKAGWIGHKLIEFADWITNFTRTIYNIAGPIAVVIILIFRKQIILGLAKCINWLFKSKP